MPDCSRRRDAARSSSGTECNYRRFQRVPEQALDEILKIALQQTLKAPEFGYGSSLVVLVFPQHPKSVIVGVSSSIGALMANAAISGNVALSHRSRSVNEWE